MERVVSCSILKRKLEIAAVVALWHLYYIDCSVMCWFCRFISVGFTVMCQKLFL